MFFALSLLVAFTPFQQQTPVFTLQHTWQICVGKHCNVRDRWVVYCDRNKRRKARHSEYLKRNIGARCCNYCWSGKAKIITYFKGVLVALGTQHAISMCNMVICGLPGSGVFLHIIAWRAPFKKILNLKCVFWLSILWSISHSKKK